MKTDIEIARSIKLQDIREVAEKLGIDEKFLELYGKYKAKINLDFLKDRARRAKLILVTAISPTPFGEGKTTVSISLSMGFWKIGKTSAVALREPSLGPVFGIKGGATGGGYAQVLPMEDINLHFTGDFHAVTSAHNLLSAMIDASIFHKNSLGIDPNNVLWPRTIDMNDRSLRDVVIGLNPIKNGPLRLEKFVITPASEVMAILGLSKNYAELKERLSNILIGFTFKKEPVFARDLKAQGAMTVLLKDAIKPNLVQTTENTPAIVHTGPFANIAHGTCSLVAIELALRACDYTVVESGFGSDLGAEKFLNIVTRELNVIPDLAVLVVSIRALKFHGGIKKEDLKRENEDALVKGLDNLRAHLNILKNTFGIRTCVAINRFSFDTDREIKVVQDFLDKEKVPNAICEGFLKGGDGAKDLAKKVIEVIEREENNFRRVYDVNMGIKDKIERIAKNVYGAASVHYSDEALKKVELCERLNFKDFYICMAKTQYSLSDNSKLKGWPKGFEIKVDDIRIKSGAKFLVPLCGDILEMPGLPEQPAATIIDMDENGVISGLF
ncbi:MAG: formate--tetrahydrofolate ligase [Candidatus Hydrothermales bacterium]